MVKVVSVYGDRKVSRKVFVPVVDLDPLVREHQRFTEKMLKEGVTTKDVNRLSDVVNRIACAVVTRRGIEDAKTHLYSDLLN